jgi:hypothetical protein
MNLSVAELERRAVEAFALLGPRCVVCPRCLKYRLWWLTPEIWSRVGFLLTVLAGGADRGSSDPLDERPS